MMAWLREKLRVLRFRPKPHESTHVDIDKVISGQIRDAVQVNLSASRLMCKAAEEGTKAARKSVAAMDDYLHKRSVAENVIARLEDTRRGGGNGHDADH